MAKHEVKCAICGKVFDTNKEQAVRHGARRYAHLSCFPSGELIPMETAPPDEEDLIKLKDYINNLFGNNANWPMIMKQIKKYKEDENYTYSGMLKSLVYYYDIKKNPVTDIRANGIGIIPICYKDAFNYYLSIWQANQINKEKIKEYSQATIEVSIPPPIKQPLKIKLFKELEDEYGE